MVSSPEVVYDVLHIAFSEVPQVVHFLGGCNVSVGDHCFESSLPRVEKSNVAVEDVWVALRETLF